MTDLDRIYLGFGMEAKDDEFEDVEDDQEEAVVDKTLIKRDPIPPKYTITSYVEPILEANLPKQESKVMRYIGAYHEKYSYCLETIYMTKYPMFTERDKNFMFDTLGIDREHLNQLIKNMELPDSYKILKYYIVDYTVLPVILCRYYLKKKDQKKANLMYYWMGYSLYWMAYTTTFKRFNPSPQVVQYTMNSIGEKYKLKQLGSVNKWIFDMIQRIMITYRELVLRGADYDYYKIVDAARTKIGNSVKHIGDRIITNAKNKMVMLEGQAQDAEGNATLSASISESVTAMAEKYTTQFFRSPANMKVIKIACSKLDVSVNEIRGVMENIKADPKNNYDDVKLFTESLISIVLTEVDGDASILNNKLKFFAVANSAYKKGNTADPNMIRIRDILGNWLTKGSPLYRNLTRVASQSNFRKAVYIYMAYTLATDQ